MLQKHAKLIVSYMLVGLHHGIKLTEKDQPRRPPSRGAWTSLDDMTLMGDVEWYQREHGLSEREAIRITAEAFPPDMHRFPYKANGRKSPKSSLQKRYEDALRSRWIENTTLKAAKFESAWLNLLPMPPFDGRPWFWPEPETLFFSFGYCISPGRRRSTTSYRRTNVYQLLDTGDRCRVSTQDKLHAEASPRARNPTSPRILRPLSDERPLCGALPEATDRSVRSATHRPSRAAAPRKNSE